MKQFFILVILPLFFSFFFLIKVNHHNRGTKIKVLTIFLQREYTTCKVKAKMTDLVTFSLNFKKQRFGNIYF